MTNGYIHTFSCTIIEDRKIAIRLVTRSLNHTGHIITHLAANFLLELLKGDNEIIQCFYHQIIC